MQKAVSWKAGFDLEVTATLVGIEAMITDAPVAAADAMTVTGGKPMSRGICERLGNIGI